MSRTIFGLISITIGLGLIIGVWWHVNQPPSLSQEWNEHDAVLTFVANPSQLLFKNDCYILKWQTENINAIYLNDNGIGGVGEEKVCSNSLVKVDFRDGTQGQYRIAPSSFFVNPNHWWVFWAISICLVIGIFSLSHLPLQWRQDLHDWKRDLRTAIHSFSRTEIIQLGLLIFFSTIVFLRNAHQQSVDTDEMATLLLARNQLDLVISNYRVPNNHVFATSLANLSYLIFGYHTLTLRLPVVIFTILSVPAAYWVGRRYVHKTVGLLCVTLVITHPALNYYGGIVRGYPIQMTLILVLVGLLPYLSHRINQVAWLCYAVITALAFFTLPTSVYPITGISLFLGVIIWLNNKGIIRRQILTTWIIFTLLAALFTLILYSPILVNWGLRSLVGNEFVASERTSDLLIDIWMRFLNSLFLYLMPLSIIPYGQYLALGLGLLGLWLGRKHTTHVSLLVVLMLLSPIAWVLLLRPGLSSFERVFICLMPFLVLALASGLVWFGDRWRPLHYVYSVMAWVFFGVWFAQQLLTPIPIDTASETAKRLLPLMQPKSYIIIHYLEIMMYHFYEQGVEDPYQFLYSREIPLKDVNRLYFITGEFEYYTENYDELVTWFFGTRPAFVPRLLFEVESTLKKKQIWSVDLSETGENE